MASRIFDIPKIIICLGLQVAFWYGIEGGQLGQYFQGTRHLKPTLGVVPELPTYLTIQATSFGDEQFYFRKLAFDIQNAGDSFGRATPLKDYDYDKLFQWWTILDSLDPISNYVPSLVSYYFAASQEVKRDVPYVVDYLETHADRDPAGKWWWYTQAVYHARHRLEDEDRALQIATKLNEIPKHIEIPFWARQLKAFILEDRGELEEAYIIIRDILDNIEDIPEHELNFMQYFLLERLERIEEDVKATQDITPPKEE